MLTIFTIPKAFTGENGILQRNAVNSWKRAFPGCEIILFGDDPGVPEAAAKLGVRNLPAEGKTSLGTPLLSSAFSRAQAEARGKFLMYTNADIIFLEDFTPLLEAVGGAAFLLSGRRWDLDVTEEIRFNDAAAAALRKRLAAAGTIHGFSGMDYFVFPKGSIAMPPFAVGRAGWDSWLVYHARSAGVPVIDATGVVTAIHQNHDYSHSKFGEKKRVGGPELQYNIELAGGLGNMMTMREADWLLSVDGLKRPGLFRRILALLAVSPLWRLLMLAKRKLHTALGA